ncbi:MAG TPA: methyltransferase domain-containing protein [Anaerolineaceae bacterium]|nr:methyltransferase domain-containing protein [Anaerolineaceae bacterium]
MQNVRWDASDYEKHSTNQQAWGRELIEKLNLRGDEILLDIGCGDGKVTAEIAARLPNGRVTGVDLSAEMIDLASRRYPEGDFPNLSFEQADASHLPYSAQFTRVFSNATLHWICDHHPVLAGIQRSLKPGGKILLQMGGRGNAAEIIACVDRLIQLPEWAGYFGDFVSPYGFHSPEDYTVWLREAGLEPVRVELIPKDMVHPDHDTLAGWIRTTWMPYTLRVPAGQRDAFIEQIIAEYRAGHPADADGALTVKMARLEVEAIRP